MNMGKHIGNKAKTNLVLNLVLMIVMTYKMQCV